MKALLTLERSREESWEAVSNRVSTLVESSVTSISGRLTELEHAVQSQRTTPSETEDVVADAETWAAMEQVMWARQCCSPPEDQNPKGCSLHSMEPLRDWFL